MTLSPLDWTRTMEIETRSVHTPVYPGTYLVQIQIGARYLGVLVTVILPI